MKAVVFTLGCKVNSRESSCLITGLKEKGFETSDKLEPADVYIINTCAVTAEAEKKSRQAIARAKKFNASARIFICGCASQKNPEAFIIKGAQVVTGAKAKDKILDLLDNKGIFIEQSDEYYEKYLPSKSSKTREYVKIQDGCNNFCSYCIIPYLRGRSRSRKIENIVEEIKALDSQEIVITGINVSAFDDNGKKLPELLYALKDFDCRFRFGSLEVGVISEELLTATKQLKDFAPHFHLSLQSGSDSVLKSMNRHYTRAEYLEKCAAIRRVFPDAAITTDIIVGFPTETEEDFLQSLRIVSEAGFAQIHAFPYSPREGTNAYKKYKELPSAVKKARVERILAVGATEKRRYMEQFVGKCLTVVPEHCIDGYTEGYSENYIRVFVEGDVGKAPVCVRAEALFKDGLKASIIKE